MQISTTKPIRIIGIDPGSRLTGCAVIESSGGKTKCLMQTTLRAKGSMLSERIVSLAEQLQTIICEYQPTEASIEQVFVKLNPQSALTLGQARGALLLTLAKNNIAIAQYAPRAIKKAATGYGAATKSQMQQMMQQLFNLDKLPQEDAADAIGASLCHANTRNWHNKISKLNTDKTTKKHEIWI
jgi:crossover junction endodeoxyribonuclease RuvC